MTHEHHLVVQAHKREDGSFHYFIDPESGYVSTRGLPIWDEDLMDFVKAEGSLEQDHNALYEELARRLSSGSIIDSKKATS